MEKIIKCHPIQLQYVGIRELHIKSLVPPTSTYNYDIDIDDISQGSYISDFDEENSCITVGLKTSLGHVEGKAYPFEFVVEIAGVFSVDVGDFAVESLDSWASGNAPVLLSPFMREQVFSLTAKCGFSPYILPLVELPYFKAKK